MPDDFEVYKNFAVVGFFGLIGGFAKMARAIKNGERFTVVLFFCNCLISFVCGGIVGLFLYGTWEMAATLALGCVAGYAGAPLLDAAERKFLDRVKAMDS